jgi:hypothetical protein
VFRYFVRKVFKIFMDEPITVIFVVTGPDIMAISRVHFLKFLELVSNIRCTVSVLDQIVSR